jgi:hypothetical protein
VGCVLARETGVLVVLTDNGPVRASYGARMLCAIARDRSRAPVAGEWVTVHRWCDGPVTVEDVLTRPYRSSALATVLPLHRNRDRVPLAGAAEDLAAQDPAAPHP